MLSVEEQYEEILIDLENIERRIKQMKRATDKITSFKAQVNKYDRTLPPNGIFQWRNDIQNKLGSHIKYSDPSLAAKPTDFIFSKDGKRIPNQYMYKQIDKHLNNISKRTKHLANVLKMSSPDYDFTTPFLIPTNENDNFSRRYNIYLRNVLRPPERYSNTIASFSDNAKCPEKIHSTDNYTFQHTIVDKTITHNMDSKYQYVPRSVSVNSYQLPPSVPYKYRNYTTSGENPIMMKYSNDYDDRWNVPKKPTTDKNNYTRCCNTLLNYTRSATSDDRKIGTVYSGTHLSPMIQKQNSIYNTNDSTLSKNSRYRIYDGNGNLKNVIAVTKNDIIPYGNNFYTSKLYSMIQNTDSYRKKDIATSKGYLNLQRNDHSKIDGSDYKSETGTKEDINEVSCKDVPKLQYKPQIDLCLMRSRAINGGDYTSEIGTNRDKISCTNFTSLQTPPYKPQLDLHVTRHGTYSSPNDHSSKQDVLGLVSELNNDRILDTGVDTSNRTKNAECNRVLHEEKAYSHSSLEPSHLLSYSMPSTDEKLLDADEDGEVLNNGTDDTIKLDNSIEDIRMNISSDNVEPNDVNSKNVLSGTNTTQNTEQDLSKIQNYTHADNDHILRTDHSTNQADQDKECNEDSEDQNICEEHIHIFDVEQNDVPQSAKNVLDEEKEETYTRLENSPIEAQELEENTVDSCELLHKPEEPHITEDVEQPEDEKYGYEISNTFNESVENSLKLDGSIESDGIQLELDHQNDTGSEESTFMRDYRGIENKGSVDRDNEDRTKDRDSYSIDINMQEDKQEVEEKYEAISENITEGKDIQDHQDTEKLRPSDHDPKSNLPSITEDGGNNTVGNDKTVVVDKLAIDHDDDNSSLDNKDTVTEKSSDEMPEDKTKGHNLKEETKPGQKHITERKQRALVNTKDTSKLMRRTSSKEEERKIQGKQVVRKQPASVEDRIKTDEKQKFKKQMSQDRRSSGAQIKTSIKK